MLIFNNHQRFYRKHTTNAVLQNEYTTLRFVMYSSG